MLGNSCSFGSFRDDNMSSYKLTKATVLFGSLSAKIARSWRAPGRKPAASIWLTETRQVVMNSETQTPPRVGRHLSWRR